MSRFLSFDVLSLVLMLIEYLKSSFFQRVFKKKKKNQPIDFTNTQKGPFPVTDKIKVVLFQNHGL